MPKFMITFGQVHPLKDNWVEVIASNETEARKVVFEVFGKKWEFMYKEEEFKSEYFPKGQAGFILLGE